jgi:hypothetical protein
MELLDGYLKAVGQNLPKAQRDDIVKELSENIRSQIENKEAELGRPLNEAEVGSVLKQHGHPLIVAGRYRHDERSLTLGRRIIGPALFPFYARVLSFNLGISTVVVAMVLITLFVGGLPITPHAAFYALFWQFAIQLGIVTLIFAVTDKYFAAFPDQWDPRKPYADYSRYLNESAAGSPAHVPRFESFAQLTAAAVFLVWLRAVAHSAYWIFGPAIGAFQIEPIWHRVYLPFVLLIFAQMLQAGVNLIRPDWAPFRSAVRVGGEIAGLAILYLVLKAGDLVAVRGPATTAADERVAHLINKCFFSSMLVTAAVCGALLVFHLRSLLQELQNRSASSQLR